MANPTTNYGFVLPTSTDLVTDLPADFDVALQGVDTRLKALQPGTTLGDIAYSSATANTNTRLGIGSTGQVLTVVSGVPAWASAAGGGKVLQVVQGTANSVTTINGTTYADSGLSASITPSSVSSKVMVLVTQNTQWQSPASSTSNFFGMKLLRGATTIVSETGGGSNALGLYISTASAIISMAQMVALSYLDSPATTSATTYKTQFAHAVAGGQINLQSPTALSTIILLEIGA